jgi:hypothetical protein
LDFKFIFGTKVEKEKALSASEPLYSTMDLVSLGRTKGHGRRAQRVKVCFLHEHTFKPHFSELSGKSRVIGICSRSSYTCANGSDVHHF